MTIPRLITAVIMQNVLSNKRILYIVECCDEITLNYRKFF